MAGIITDEMCTPHDPLRKLNKLAALPTETLTRLAAITYLMEQCPHYIDEAIAAAEKYLKDSNK